VRRGGRGGVAPGPLDVTPAGVLGGRPRVAGWGGEGSARPALSVPARTLLVRMLRLDGHPPPPADLEDLELPEPALSDTARARLRAAVGEANVAEDRRERASHAAGKSYEDLVRLRAGDASTAPDAVVWPGSPDELPAVLAACSEERVAVVPFGGGTSVVGGVDGLRGGFPAVISLDLSRLDRLLTLDARSLTATFETGIGGRRAEALLDGQGFTLGHFPQSFEFATLGGYLATRSAGQASTRIGRFEELVLGLRCATPAGELRVEAMPASAAGPSLRDLVVGSEGAFGVVTEATLAIRARPAERRYEGWSLPSFAAGAEALRELAQVGAAPDVARLSDPGETDLALVEALAAGGLAARGIRRYLRARGHARPCLAVLGFEGERPENEARRRRAAGSLRTAGGLALGARPGRAWARTRFEGPYLRDALLDMGVLTETLETATTWSRLDGLYRAVGDALERSLAEGEVRPLVGCHVSHVYPAGASLYFTVLARQRRGAELEQWRAAKAAATEAILTAGGTLTHHHAVGRAHAPWLDREIGAVGVAALRAVKDRLDPAGIMNPGKLLPPEDEDRGPGL
jgi:alkyldihydroxyacetonephosphate synthase